MSKYEEATERFRRRIRAERERRGWTQVAMAARLNDIGIPMHPTSYAKVESGERGVGIHEAYAVADLFGISVDSLWGQRSRLKSDLLFTTRRIAETLSRSRLNASAASATLLEQAEELEALDEQGRYVRLVEHCRQVAESYTGLASLVEGFDFAGGEVGRGTKAMMRAMLDKESGDA